MTDAALKISFCTTCKGRLEHLKRTLPENLKNNADYPNVEFVILDYGSEDGLADWIKQNYQNEIKSGKIRYARFETPYFKMSHAKNMAHRLATGDILCNLDADNLTTPGFAASLNRIFSEKPNSIVRVHRNIGERANDLVKREMRCFSKVHSVQNVNIGVLPETLRVEESIRGMGGRIAVSKENFEQLHGYDESYKGWGGEDDDFFRRAVSAGLKSAQISKTEVGAVIYHTDLDRMINMAPDEQMESQGKLAERTELNKETLRDKAARKAMRLIRRSPVKEQTPSALVNAEGCFGCGSVYINFNEAPLDIGPMMNTFVGSKSNFKKSFPAKADAPTR